MVIVAAVDRSARAESVIYQAGELAEAYGEPVHVVHALSRSEFFDLAVTDYEAGEEAVTMEEIKSHAASHAESVASSLDVDYECVGLVGNAAAEVARYAETADARYIVLAPRRRSPAGKALFGSVAQSILLQAPCPVVTVIKGEE